MQIKDIYLNPKSTFSLFVKIAVVVIAVYFIHLRFRAAEVKLDSLIWPDHSAILLALVFLLMLLNWSLEAYRWKLSVNLFESTSYFASLTAVLAGLALNWVLPFTSGDVVARLSQRKDKYLATSAMVVNRGLMLSFTLIFGLISISSYSTAVLPSDWLWLLLGGMPLVAIWFFRKRLSRFLNYFKKIRRKDLIEIIAISVLRYMVFVVQFYLLLHLFLPELLAKEIFFGIGWIFFFKSIFPSILGGLGVREASGLVYFSTVMNPAMVVIPVFLIWVINSMIPSIAGLFVISSWRARNIT